MNSNSHYSSLQRSVFGGVSLLPLETIRIVISRNSCNVSIPFRTFNVDDEMLMNRIWEDLAGIFDSRSLIGLRAGTYCFFTLYMVRFWSCLVSLSVHSVEWGVIQEALEDVE
jgi:hypothetical protein